MRFTLILTSLLLLGCGGDAEVRVPPVGVGGGGARILQDAKTPAEAYENAFASFTPCHNRVRRGLGTSVQQNYRDAAAALEEVTGNLRIMQALVVDASKPAFDPYIADYADLAKAVDRQNAPANWQTRLDRNEREIKSKFSFLEAQIVTQWPEGMGPQATTPAPKPPAPAPDSAPAPTPVPPPSPAMPPRLAYRAWKQSHTDLVAAFQGGKEAASPYADVQAALAAMKQGLPAARHAKIDLMLAVYEQQNGETRGFTTVPPHGSKELILKQLDVVKESLEAEYDPDKK
jgi:hypothetical protein